jgi:hypothetical protein
MIPVLSCHVSRREFLRRSALAAAGVTLSAGFARSDGSSAKVSLRKFPFPFRNMLAILSDTDLSSKVEFEGMHRFMNTEIDCEVLGPGVGLDVGDTFWMGSVGVRDDGRPPTAANQRDWRYWHLDTRRELFAADIRRYLQAGWIDIPHTFFDCRDKSQFRRDHAADAVKEWARIGFQPLAWVDHANNPWNVAQYRRGRLAAAVGAGQQTLSLAGVQMRLDQGDYLVLSHTGEKAYVEAGDSSTPEFVHLAGPLARACPADSLVSIHRASDPNEGAVPSSRNYVADLAAAAGVKVYWARLPYDVALKSGNGRRGFGTTLIPETLPDGRNVWGMLRYYEQGQTNNTWLGACIRRVLFGDALTLQVPMAPDTYMILSTHLGYADADGIMDQFYKTEDNVYSFNGRRWFNEDTVAAFRELRAAQDHGRVLVARTTRLLRYNMVHDRLTGSPDGYRAIVSGKALRILIACFDRDQDGSKRLRLDDLRGITFYADEPDRVEIWLGDEKVPAHELQINPPDYAGRASLGVKWYPADRTDYTAT